MILIPWFTLVSRANVGRRVTHRCAPGHLVKVQSRLWLMLSLDRSRSHPVSPLLPSLPASLHIDATTFSFCNLSSTQPFIFTAGSVKSSSTLAFSLSHSASGERKSHYSYTCGKNRPFILIGTVNRDQQGYWSFLRTSKFDSFWKDVEFIFWLWGRKKKIIDHPFLIFLKARDVLTFNFKEGTVEGLSSTAI